MDHGDEDGRTRGNPDDCWYMGPFSSVRIDRGMMLFAHGATTVFSRGLVREARSWLPLCSTYFDNAEGNADDWGDVAIGKCFDLVFSVCALRPSKRLGHDEPGPRYYIGRVGGERS